MNAWVQWLQLHPHLLTKDQKYRSIEEKLLSFSARDYYLALSDILLPFEIISSKTHSQDDQKDCPSKQQRKNQAQLEQRDGKKSQETLENSQLFTQRLKELNKYKKIIVVFVQRSPLENNNQKGYLIVAPLYKAPAQFLTYIRLYFKIKQTESISMLLKSPTGMKTISPQAKFQSMPLNEKGFIYIETVKMETMG